MPPSQVLDEAKPKPPGDDSGRSSPSAAAEAPVPTQTMPATQFWLLSLGVCLGLLLAMMDTSIVATSLYSIGSEFGDLAGVNWVALAYTLAYMGCAVVFARVSDLTGRRDALAAAFVLFVAFSLGCGWARSMPQLIALRTLQGLGGSGLYSLAMIVLPETSPPHLRRHISAAIGFVVAMAGVLGPVLGGLLTHYASWRWIFWINGPVGIVALGIFLLSWPRKKEHRPVMHRHSWRQLDYPGAILTTAAAVLVVFAFQNSSSSSSTVNHWGSALFIVPLVLGIVSWIALFAWQYTIERRLAARFSPIFPIRLFHHALYASGLLNTLLLGFPYLLLVYVVPLRIQVVGGKSPLLAGVMLLPMLVAVAVGSIASGVVNSRKRMIAESLLVGSCLMLLGCGLLTTLSVQELDAAKLLGLITFCGLGFGLTVSSSTMIASQEVPRRDYASAQGILAQLRILGGSMGIAASTAILRREMTGAASSPSSPSSSPSSSHFYRAEQAAVSDDASHHVRKTYAQAFHTDMVVATIISALAVAFTLLALLQQQSRNRTSRATSSRSTEEKEEEEEEEEKRTSAGGD
ncbi:hypothetical protein E4U43_003413 [Claviceps pusilla]|uniref:Major facilitator superfamily (MFS) profile domain-containing protein n=1 Tax=Claviceps pusilla TaxID=123648 RepID=A0A9P7N5E3_9HYPO|nr:hypothetical protein E4U43_003413 [Claviceps pusilla]